MERGTRSKQSVGRIVLMGEFREKGVERRVESRPHRVTKLRYDSTMETLEVMDMDTQANGH